MSDILRETWAYQEIMQEGELRGLHRTIQDAEILRHLIVKMSTVQTAEEAFQYLFTIDKEERRTDTGHDEPAVSD